MHSIGVEIHPWGEQIEPLSTCFTSFSQNVTDTVLLEDKELYLKSSLRI